MESLFCYIWTARKLTPRPNILGFATGKNIKTKIRKKIFTAVGVTNRFI